MSTRQEALSTGRRKAEARRVKNPVRPGRPPKSSGVYYTHHIAIDEDMYRVLHMHKMPGEPIGAVFSRLWKKAEQKQKNAEALEQELEASVDDPRIWKYINNKAGIKDIPVYRQATIET